MKSSNAATPSTRPERTTCQLIKCQVNVRAIKGDKHHYAALFPSTCDAVMDAFDRFGLVKVSVEAIKAQEEGGAA